MCLGVPGRIVDTHDDRGTPMATVDFGGVTKTVCLAYTPDAGIGDYTIIHAGFAIAILDEQAALESLELFEQLGIVSATTDEIAP
ncbi:MAG: HypC/HybG/HupF family hydrogenase formation chaperone [Acidimicrobiia bacterium]|nr:HypC/HybG/HupF family hydrogenase formation chaperone [Acidimicrobiia bacterium]